MRTRLTGLLFCAGLVFALPVRAEVGPNGLEAEGGKGSKTARNDTTRGLAELNFALRWGTGGRTNIGCIGGMLIRADLYDPATYKTTETIEERFRRTKTFGGMLSLRPRAVPLYIDLSVDYEWTKQNDGSGGQLDTADTGEDYQNWDFRYSDTLGLRYWVWCNYEYTVISGRLYLPAIGFKFGTGLLFLGWHPGDGFGESLRSEYLSSPKTITIGPVFGGGVALNTNPRGIAYRSNQPLLGPDEQIQANLNNSLVGKTIVSWFYGFDVRWRFMGLSATWYRSNSDAIRTEANPYYLQEVRNVRRTDWLWSLRVTLPLAPSLNKK